MEKKERIDDILNREWAMFQRVQNVGGKADCQEDEASFRIMRGAQFEAWNDAMLASYQHDLAEAEENGHNLLSEKYGYMMEFTHPKEYQRISMMLPQVSAEKETLIREILAIEIPQTAKFREMYPHLGKRGRPLTATENSVETSVETYSRGELSTYSVETLREYLRYLQKLEQSHILFPLLVMKATVRACGYLSLDAAERASR